jgi:hypothetical protein
MIVDMIDDEIGKGCTRHAKLEDATFAVMRGWQQWSRDVCPLRL